MDESRLALEFEIDEEEEETPESLRAEADQAKKIADLLRRHDAGSLATLFKRWGVSTPGEDE